VNQLPADVFNRGVLRLVAASFALLAIARLARAAQEYRINIVARRVSAQLYATTVAHSLLLPFRIYEERRSGALLHTMQRARDDAEQSITSAVRLYLGALAMTVIAAYAFYVHPLLGTLQLAIIATLGAFLVLVSRPIHRYQQKISAQLASEAGATTERMRNVELVKSLGLEEQEIGRLHRLHEQILQLEEQKLRLVRIFTFVEGTALSAARAIMMLAMLWLLSRREITVGEFLTLFLYLLTSAFAPLTELGHMVVRYQQARATFGQLDDELMGIPTQTTSASATRIERLADVRFDAVSLTYPTGVAALRSVSFALHAGDTVAFVGPSGSGKSTIVKLLVGLYQPGEGALAFNGIDAELVDRDDLRRRIGLVTQDTHLFAATIRENLLIGLADASDADCLAALARASATPILERGGHGLDTRIGEGGLTLSGGERQRLAIARALLRTPELLIFDEATSHLDSLTERAVSDTIRELAAGDPTRITVLIAHRLGTVAGADCIHVLEHGRIVDRGTHAELLARGGLYARMWREQSEPVDARAPA
jgi:ATP-binding cassette subfamily B protein